MEEQRIKQIEASFREHFPGTPRFFRAPGRVNLIGEHTDYNDGFVLPFAINRETVVAGRPRQDSIINVQALDVNDAAKIDLQDAPIKQRGNWIDYVEGSIRCVGERFGELKGADLVFSSTLPIGGGLSSSAALEVSIAFAMLALNGYKIDREKLAFAAQKAEHEFVGIRSGIMDQFTSVFGRADNALLLDCRSQEIEYIPLRIGEAVIAVCDTKVKHDLASSEYNTRRKECEEGVSLLKEHLPTIEALRDVNVEDFEKYQGSLPDNIRRRCRHVITENARTLAAADAFRQSDVAEAGKLMSASHSSLRNDYEVSSPELDLLVDAAASVSGVYGARMTGGGFGGCTVSMLNGAALDEFRQTVTSSYSQKFQIEPDIYLFQAADGASEVTV